MCGICGIVTQNSTLDTQAIVHSMVGRLYHRGPDDSGCHFQYTRDDGVLGIGSTRLSVIDLTPAGHQPMQDSTTGNWIVYNGEIYNFLELKRQLEEKGCQFISGTDTEVILKAFSEWGHECLKRFRGMYSFALWDERENSLWLVRDRLGVKPLYYYYKDGLLIFASEVRALLASGCIPKKLSPEGVDTYLALGGVRDPWTIIHQVYSMPAGSYGIYKDNEFKISTYWSPPQEINDQYSGWTREKVVQKLREQLIESVRLRLISDVPLGVFLSGGVDSSSIVSLAMKNAQQTLHTVSIIFNEKEYSEASSIRLVSQHYRSNHSEILLTSEEMMNTLPAALAAMDQPTFDGINTYIVSKSARQAGLTVVLSGIGGDELFGGYPSFHWVPRLETFRRVVPIWLGKFAGSVLKTGLKNSSRSQKLQRWFGNQEGYAQAYYLVRELFSPESRQHLIPGLLQTNNQPKNGSLPHDKFNQISILELTDYLRNVILRDSDCMSMAHSLELREPYLDHHIVEFLLSLPGDVKAQGSVPKSLLVEAIGNLPAGITRRKKQVFHLPFKHWLQGSLQEEVEDVLLTSDRYKPPVFDPRIAQDIWQDFLEERTSWVRPWALYVLQKWVSSNL